MDSVPLPPVPISVFYTRPRRPKGRHFKQMHDPIRRVVKKSVPIVRQLTQAELEIECQRLAVALARMGTIVERVMQ
jgi:hypothetical protein